MRKVTGLFVIALIVFSFSCSKDNPVSTDENGLSLIGKVVDESGNTINGANIHFVPQFAEDTVGSSFTSAFRFSFSLPSSAYVTVVFVKHYTRDTVEYLYKNEYMNEGVHIFFTPQQLTNGIYHYVIKYDTTEIDKKFLILKNEEFLSDVLPFKKTDNSGIFNMSYNEMGIGEKFDFRYGTFPDTTIQKTISNRFKVVIFKENFQMLVNEVTVNTSLPTSKVFTLVKQ